MDAHAIAESAPRRKVVKKRVLELATALKAAHDSGAEEQAQHLLMELANISDEQAALGHEGVLALTEYCNSFVQAEALDALEAMQRDPRVGSRATALFQKLVPTIWAF